MKESTIEREQLAQLDEDVECSKPAVSDEVIAAISKIYAWKLKQNASELEERISQRSFDIERTIKNKDLFIFDADQTLRRCTVPGRFCPNGPGEWELIHGVRERLLQIDWSQKALGVASNQGGIELGYLSEPMAYQLLCDMVVAAVDHWPPVGSLQLCPHAYVGACPCRKPAPLMLHRIMQVYSISPAGTLFVGDQDTDRDAATSAGVDFMWAWEFFGWEKPETASSQHVATMEAR